MSLKRERSKKNDHHTTGTCPIDWSTQVDPEKNARERSRVLLIDYCTVCVDILSSLRCCAQLVTAGAFPVRGYGENAEL